MIMNKPTSNASMNTSSIIFGALIGTAALITISFLGISISTILTPNIEKMSSFFLLFIAAFLGITIILAFFLAGFITAKIAHQILIFDSLIHSLGAWALMSILIMILASFIAAANNIRNLGPPVLITDIRFQDPNAITKVEFDEEPKMATKKDKKLDQIMVILWWTVFLVLALGSGAAVFGGKIAHKQN
jgi:hypothetical protein